MGRGSADTGRRRSNLHRVTACVLALCTASCGTGERGRQAGGETPGRSTAESVSGRPADPAVPDTLTVLSPFDERLFGPYWSVPAKFLVFLPLVAWDGEGGIEGRLARSWEHSTDRRHWTYHLRSGIRWHDGTPVTAHDVEFSLELAGHPEVLYEDAWHDLDSVTVHDDSTLTLHYARPRDGRDFWHVYWPEHLLEDRDPEDFWEWDFWTRPVGNGPYRYVRHVPKTVTELEANPEFYAGEPAIDRVLLRFGTSNALTELRAGNVDVAPVSNRSEIPRLRDDPRFGVYYGLQPHVPWRRAILWNPEHPPFGDARVRRALTMALNRRELLRLLNLPETLRFADVPYTGRQYRRGTLPPPIGVDPPRARALLDSAGWERQEDGGPRFRFKAVAPASGELRQAAVYVQAALREVGVRMEIVAVEQALRNQRVRAGEFQAVFEPYWNHVDNHLKWLGPDSRIRYENARVAGLLRAVKETADPTERDSLYRATWPALRRDVPVTFLYPRARAVVAHRRVRGLESPYRADPMSYMEKLWIDDRTSGGG